MRTYFAEVLYRERACLAGVTDAESLQRWRHHLLEETRTPTSPYLKALRQTGNAPDRAEFLDQWRDLIAQTVRQLPRFDASDEDAEASSQDLVVDVDAEKTAVVILAALLGGSILSQLAEDAQPLNSALDLALAPLMADAGGNFSGIGPDSSASSMDM